MKCKSRDLLTTKGRIMRTSNCERCEYKKGYHSSSSAWCYMFKTKPKGVCYQIKRIPLHELPDIHKTKQY